LSPGKDWSTTLFFPERLLVSGLANKVRKYRKVSVNQPGGKLKRHSLIQPASRSGCGMESSPTGDFGRSDSDYDHRDKKDHLLKLARFIPS
jgi:hypothetical protein